MVFMLREVEGLTTEETAECLGLSTANVKVRLHRARAAPQSGIDRRLGAEVRKLHQFDGAGATGSSRSPEPHLGPAPRV
jgi:RNA polymerase sigma-70 factor (ECF subfamily)